MDLDPIDVGDESDMEGGVWLVTGAAGFIGSHLVEHLLAIGQSVRGLDNLSSGSMANLAEVESRVRSDAWDRFRFTKADIRDAAACEQAVAGVSYVLHQAALGSVPRSIEEPDEFHSVNVDGTLNIFLAAVASGVRKVVYASSSSVYGDDPHLPKTEGSVGRPLSPYAATKAINELYADVLSRTYGLPAVGLRYFNVFGPRQNPQGPYAAVIPRWIAAYIEGKAPIIFGDGDTSRDFCPVANVVQANVLAARSGEATNGAVYNVALGQTTSLNDLAAQLKFELLRLGMDTASTAPRYEPFRDGDIRHSQADISKIRSDLGYSPRTSLAEGLRDAVTSALHRGGSQPER